MWPNADMFIFLLGIISGLLATDEPDQPVQSINPDGEPGCTLDEHAYCQLIGAVDFQSASDHLGEAIQSYWINDDVIYIAARRAVGPVRLCCALQSEMEHVGEDVWATAFRLSRIDEAFIDIWPIPLPDQDTMNWRTTPKYRGPGAPPPVRRAEMSDARMTRIIMPAIALDHERSIYIYQPAEPQNPHQVPVVYLADGGNAYDYGPIADSLAQSCLIEPVIIVGLATENPAAGDPRSQSRLRAGDYLWEFDQPRYFAHERFLLEEVLPLVEEQYGGSTLARERMLSGNSNGAAWAISTALRHPDRFGVVGAASFGWLDALQASDSISRHVAFEISAGLYEPNFLPDSEEAVRRITEAGGQANLTVYASGHSPLAFEQLFASTLTEAFPAAEDCVPASD
ncbi:putative esterase [Maricaulis maris MCS10]|uniref:Putative esterase n=2 Tax=Maricaulis maris TaxID=74318 RepID=Q0AKA5_MARMM|nr:putative esterase [Maricaulis maris MCS10]